MTRKSRKMSLTVETIEDRFLPSPMVHSLGLRARRHAAAVQRARAQAAATSQLRGAFRANAATTQSGAPATPTSTVYYLPDGEVYTTRAASTGSATTSATPSSTSPTPSGTVYTLPNGEIFTTRPVSGGYVAPGSLNGNASGPSDGVPTSSSGTSTESSTSGSAAPGKSAGGSTPVVNAPSGSTVNY